MPRDVRILLWRALKGVQPPPSKPVLLLGIEQDAGRPSVYWISFFEKVSLLRILYTFLTFSSEEMSKEVR